MAAFFAIPVMAEDATLEFSYGTPGEEFKVYGYGKKETYDVAIRLGREMAGARVNGFTVPLPVEAAQVANLKGWLSSRLKLENKKNVPDLGEVEAALDDWTLTATFTEPVTVPENGVYVGYSFDVVSLATTEGVYSYPDNPIACVSGDNTDGMYVHTSRTVLKWKSIVDQLGAVSPMTVSLTGDFHADAAAVSIPAKPYVEAGHEGDVKVIITNHGSTQIGSVSYSFNANSKEGSGEYAFETPIEASFGAEGDFSFSIPAFDEYGTYPITVSIDKVNGVDNPDPQRTAESDFVVAPFVPVNRPLIEEYTGLWCGYCPAGYVALEELAEELGDNFIALSYHNGDDMEIMKDADFPIAQFQNSIGYPEAQVNRAISTYPDTDSLRDLWKQYSSEFSPVNIDVDIRWTDDSHSAIEATALVGFIERLENHNYRVAFALVADNLSDPSFVQSNNYSGKDYPGKWWELFTQGGSRVKGLVFNSILSATSDINGVEGSLPEKIEMGETYTTTHIFTMDDIRNTSGKEFLNQDCRLRVVAYIVDTENKRVVNSNTSKAESGYIPAAIFGVEADVGIAAREYYDLQGRRLSGEPDAGAYIRIDVLDNGTRKAVKMNR